MVKKTRIMIIFAIILILLFSVLFIFRSSKNKEFSIFNDDETEFNPESDIYSNSFSIAILVDEKKTKEFDIENVNKDNKKKFDISLREKIIELLGTPLPKLSRKVISSEEWTNIGKGLKREKYEEVIEKKVEKEKYEEVKFYLFTSNITVAAAYLLIPKNVTFPAPAIIAMHQHGGGEKYGTEELVGKIGDENMFYAKELAERGYIVLAVDSDTFGNRKPKKNNSWEVQEKLVAQDLFIRGLSPLSVIVQEDLVSLEFLLSRDIVDKNNIGCIGHSFGGIRCTYLAALNKRIKTVVLSGAVADLKKDTESGVTHTWLSILPNIGRLAGTSEILALIAPRPLMIITGRLDPIYPIDEVEGHLTRLTSLYERLEKKENFEAKIMIKRGHEFPKEFHEIAYQFFDKHLKNN